MSDLKRFKKDYSLDGWPVRDNENSVILHTDDLVAILNDFDRLEKSINKLKAEAVREAFKTILTDCNSFWSSDIGDTIIRYDDIKERMDERLNEIERGEL